MVSEKDQRDPVLSHLDPTAIAPRLDYLDRPESAWVSHGGVAANGTKYAAPNHAIAWGRPGCPLMPRDIREQNKGVRLSHELEQALGAPVTVDQLDAGLLEHLGIDYLSGSAVNIFRDFLYSHPSNSDRVAIPAGIPQSWFEELPLTGRTRNCVLRAFQNIGTDDVLSIPMLAREFLLVHSVGPVTLNELSCVIESAELERISQELSVGLQEVASAAAVAEHEEAVHVAALRLVKGMSSFNVRVYEFARWALAETEAKTIGEAVAELNRVGVGNEVWNPVASVSLSKLAGNPPHPYRILDEWSESMDLRSRGILKSRISCHSTTVFTLEELGRQFGVSRERMRQVEVKVRRALNSFLLSDEAASIRWRAETLSRMLGVAAPVETVGHLLRAPSGCNDHRGILLEMAGPYDQDHDWLILRSAQRVDPTSEIMAQVDEAGRINAELAHSRLTGWGLDTSLHIGWLMRDGSVRLFNDELVRWGTSIPDRLTFALADLSRPATIDEMKRHVGETRSRASVVNALGDDPRLVRVSRTRWGLASWELPEYSGVAESMRNLLAEFGGPVPVDQIAGHMHRRFGVAESTVLAYCNAPMFVVEERSLRLRTQDDGPYLLQLQLVRRTQGVFRLAPRRLGRLFKVDANILRGSGTTLTHAAGAALEVEVNANLSFTNGHGDHVQITFPETSLVGPSIGSVRRIAERLSAKEGDYLTLVLDRSDMTVTSSVTDLSNLSPGWQAISRLTGIAAPVDLEGLAKALHCHANEVRSVLRARGDDEILDHLPKSNSSTSLEEALTALEDQVESVRGDSL